MSDRHEPTTDLDAVPDVGGVVWSASPDGVHVNLVVLAPGGTIGGHVNDSLDVLIVVLAGGAVLTVDGTDNVLEPHRACVVPRGSRRGVAAGGTGVRYLTIHAARGPLGIGHKAATDV